MTPGMDIYQSVILEHNRSPRGMQEISDASHHAEGFNPICGDRVTIALKVQSQQIDAVGFVAHCCALCRASCSVLVETVQGLAASSAKDMVDRFELMLAGESWPFGGDAIAFAAIKDYPARKKCVLLPWKTFLAALSAPRNDSKGHGSSVELVVVSTENEDKG